MSKTFLGKSGLERGGKDAVGTARLKPGLTQRQGNFRAKQPQCHIAVTPNRP